MTHCAYGEDNCAQHDHDFVPDVDNTPFDYHDCGDPQCPNTGAPLTFPPDDYTEAQVRAYTDEFHSQRCGGDPGRAESFLAECARLGEAARPAPMDAREMSCTQLQRCEYYSYDDRSPEHPVHYYGDNVLPVVNFWPEVERRGEDHVFGCAGIFPTGHNPDGTERYDGPLCTFGQGASHAT
jgi:hypothetical protein